VSDPNLRVSGQTGGIPLTFRQKWDNFWAGIKQRLGFGNIQAFITQANLPESSAIQSNVPLRQMTRKEKNIENHRQFKRYQGNTNSKFMQIR
jgi:hypothetical protein